MQTSSILFKAKSAVFLTLLILLLGVRYQAHAQYYGDEQTYGIGLTGGYDMPKGNLGNIYKAAPSYGVNLFLFSGRVTGTVGLGFREYKPKQATFYYEDGNDDYGTISYGNFKSTMAYLGGAYNFPLGTLVKLYAGFNLGLYTTKYTSYSEDSFVIASEDISERQGYGAPKLGLNIAATDHFLINLEGAYNFFSPLGRRDYNDRVGTVYKSITTGGTLIYKF
jgi:hypothetical protein